MNSVNAMSLNSNFLMCCGVGWGFSVAARLAKTTESQLVYLPCFLVEWRGQCLHQLLVRKTLVANSLSTGSGDALADYIAIIYGAIH
jgi:hypothetical protein